MSEPPPAHGRFDALRLLSQAAPPLARSHTSISSVMTPPFACVTRETIVDAVRPPCSSSTIRPYPKCCAMQTSSFWRAQGTLNRPTIHIATMQRSLSITRKNLDARFAKAILGYGKVEEDDFPPKAPVVAIGQLACALGEELVGGHCSIVPIRYHLTMFEAGDDEWDGVLNFMRCFMRIFALENEVPGPMELR
ncbi:hypothetical protein BV22DRAFT_1132835 [Leucogyrophana mollusca]|uniref:Uncharacterized protein n=1 Tax=Leucogyrophana mollusca TaxID=85980 RepID=A0ACB8B5N7_9AGAM|nr:hypothetical protein BV22DRAFT_1132835 [Leucogyrophana mollusca]